MRNLISEARRLLEWECYVDKHGIAHDDEGNTWETSSPEGHYGLHNAPPEIGKRAYSRPKRRRPTALSQAQKEQKAVLDRLVAKRPRDNFLKSIRSQVASGKVLSDKQKKAVRRSLYINKMKPEADHFR